MFTQGSASLQLFSVVWILLRSLGVICCNKLVHSEGHKTYFKDLCFMNSQPTFLYLTYFNSLWPYYQKDLPDIFKLHNSLKLSFTSILGLCSNFVDCKSFFQSNSPDMLVVCETILDDSIDFSVRG